MPRMQDVDPDKWERIKQKMAEKLEKKPTGDREQWEREVIKIADHFTVIRNPGRSTAYRAEYKALPNAVTDARSEERSMLYAVTAQGRSVLIPAKDWDEHVTIWNQKG